MTTPSSDRLPPYSEEAEAAVLGCVLADESRSAEIMGRAVALLKAGPDCFYTLNHKTVYEVCLRFFKEGHPITLLSVRQALKDAGLLDKIGGSAYLAALPTLVPSPENLCVYASTVAEKYARRTLIATCAEISAAAFDESHAVNGQLDLAATALTGCAALFPAKQPRALSISDLQTPAENDPDELLSDRYLCRGGTLLVCGPTHAGKSSLDMQMAISWSLNLPFLGIRPARPLRSLIIQAENDDGEMALMRDGVCGGLNLSPEQRAVVGSSVFTYREDTLRGPRFFSEIVTPLLEIHTPDLLILDPTFNYIAGEVSNQRDVTTFCRNQLHPLIRRFHCGCMLVHHTNKPATGKEKPEWRAGEYAYLGSGSAEWANFPRAVLSIQSIGSHSVFDLHAAKRGKHLRWRDEHDQPTYVKRIAHDLDPGRICWREADPEEGPEDEPKKGRKTSCTCESLVDLLSEPLTLADWMRKSEELDISRATFYRLKKEALQQQLVSFDYTLDKWSVSK